MWERWRQGRTLHQIAQLFNRPHTSATGNSVAHRRHSTAGATLFIDGADTAERQEISRAMAAASRFTRSR